MLKFRIPAVDSAKLGNTKQYTIDELQQCKKQLNACKTMIDKVWKDDRPRKFWAEFDPFKRERKVIALLGNTYNVTNAWIKCYEMLAELPIIPAAVSNFVHFDNAAFPGSFVLATHHFVKTLRPEWKPSAYVWYASSLIDKNELDAEPLEDRYELYKNYPEHWLMTDEHRGDILQLDQQKYFAETLDHRVDLYTSDVGFDVSSDYNEQEMLQLPVNLGQIISGLITLKSGGHLITKQYTAFESITVSVIGALSTLFKELYICKPYSSREANSETYLVGISLLEELTLEHPVVKALTDRMTGVISIDVPLFAVDSYPREFLQSIIESGRELTQRQSEKIKQDVQHALDAARDDTRIAVQKHPLVQSFRDAVDKKLEAWYLSVNIMPVQEDCLLDMRDVYHQKML